MTDPLATELVTRRRQLIGVAYRMLGSIAEAEEVVQEAWIRASRSDLAAIENLGGWLATIVARLCLNRLERRKREHQLRLPDPLIGPADAPDDTTALADSVGLALQVVIETLPPAERVAFVLHDIFGLAFDAIAPVLARTPAATRQLASRGRRRVQLVPPRAETAPARQRALVDAFFAAARARDFDALLAILDENVVLRSDGGALRSELSIVLRGADKLAHRAIALAPPPTARVVAVRVNGSAGAVVLDGVLPVSVMSFAFGGDRIIEIDTLADPDRMARHIREAGVVR